MEQYEKVHLKPYTLLFKTTIKGVTRQPQEKRMQMTKNVTCVQHLKTSIETSHCWSLQQCKKLEDDNKSPITLINNYDKRKQHGEAYKITMNKIMQEIIPPQLVIFSLIHPSFFFFFMLTIFPYFFVEPTPLPFPQPSILPTFLFLLHAYHLPLSCKIFLHFLLN
jgi:hypothetical protein